MWKNASFALEDAIKSKNALDSGALRAHILPMRIQRLNPILVDQIAAGEVIERPAAALKELIENAIDAQAKRIEIRIEQGGRRRILVVDDGMGMGPDDLALAVERHATSKLPEGDLERIATLGFRGEALPSIGAVSRLKITSRARGGESAYSLAVEGGRVAPIRPAALGQGTRIEVEDLFYATPARLKFLKGDRAEAQAAALVVRRLALARPDVAFALSGDLIAPLTLDAYGSDTAARARRIAEVLGRDFEANAVPIAAERGDVRLSGLVSLPTYHRASAVDQYFFVNGRPVRDKVLIGALKAAYADTITAGRHPMVALYLDLDPAAVDVNVHPAKLEVRFRDGEIVRGLLVSSLRDALAGAGYRASSRGGDGLLARLAASQAALSAEAGFGAGALDRAFYGEGAPSGGSAGAGRASVYAQPNSRAGFGQKPLSFVFPTQSKGASGFADDGAGRYASVQGAGFEAQTGAYLAEESAQGETERAEGGPCPPLGYARAQLHGTYILAQTTDGLVIVDQHAAHERLVYEKLRLSRAQGGIARQVLLIPVVVDLPASVIGAVLERLDALEQSGLVVEPFGPGALAVREVPAALAHLDAGAFLRDLADHIEAMTGVESLQARTDLILKTMACHSSIRAGRRMKLEEMDALLREMEATPGSGQCNHGRPTSIKLDLGALESLFGR